MMYQSSIRSMTRAAGRLTGCAMTLAMLLLAAPQVQGAVPATVLIEGVLYATGGGPASDGNYQVAFGVYESKSGGAASWSETATIAVKNGAFYHVLGSVKPVPADTYGKLKSAWLSVKVANDPAMPRQQMHAVIYARHAAVAETAKAISCTGCVSVKALKFDADLDLGSKGLKAGKITSAAVAAGSVTANTFVGDGSKLTGIKIPKGSCPSGKLVSGIKADGSLNCVSGASASLPKDGIDEISNDLIFNQFNDIMASKNAPVPIADNNPVGTADTIDVPDIGSAQKLTVSVDITNSDISTISVVLYDPANKTYTLYNKGAKGGKLASTYPAPSKPVSGDLTYWVGKNPKGKWRLKVTDTKFLNNKYDGAIKSWSVNIQTLSNQKIQIKANLIVDKTLTVAALNAGTLKLPIDKGACNAAKAGHLRYANGKAELCDGKGWNSLAPKNGGAIYRWNVWSTYNQTHGWYGGNSTTFFGGVKAQQWGDGNGMAYQMSSTTDVLKTLFWRKGPLLGSDMKNAMVHAQEWGYTSSTNSRHTGVLFRISNTTSKNVNWNACWYRTSYGGWSERASVALNGSNVWDSGGSNYGASSTSCHNMSIPANRTSTVIFVNASSSASGTRGNFLAFYNNCLTLPKGLEFIDDLDTKPNGWNN